MISVPLLAVQVPSRSGRSGNDIDGAYVYEVETLLLCHTVPKGVTVNSEYCCKFLENHLGPVIRQKRSLQIQCCNYFSSSKVLERTLL